MSYSVDTRSDVPPSRQLVDAVLDALASGRLAALDQLPSVRGMAQEALVNHNTVARAYRDLEHLGVVEGENGRGVFVSARGPEIARTARRQATLDRFELAMNEALRAGHGPAALRRMLDRMEKRKSA